MDMEIIYSANIICSLGAVGWSSDNTDCFDEEPAVHANQSEVCDGLDNDCDGFTDDEDDQLEEFIVISGTDSNGNFVYEELEIPLTEFYLDQDTDGYGDTSSVVLGCEAPSDGNIYVQNGDDCYDDAPSLNPADTTAMVFLL